MTSLVTPCMALPNGGAEVEMVPSLGLSVTLSAPAAARIASMIFFELPT